MGPDFYYYISRSKIQMLLEQIPNEHLQEKEVSWTLGFKSFLGISSKRKEKVNPIQQLITVISSLRGANRIGTLSSPLEYIEDTLPMRWGIFHIGNNYPMKDLGDKAPVVFLGQDADSTIILIGSPVHLTGRRDVNSFSAIWSASDVIHYALGDIVKSA